MHSFFSKIFIAFFGTMLCATALCGGVFYFLQKANIEDAQQKGQENMLARVVQMTMYSGQAAFGVYKQSGLEAYVNYIDEIGREVDTEILIFLGDEQRSLRGKSFSRRSRPLYKRAVVSGEYEWVLLGSVLYMAKKIESKEQKSYVIIAQHKLPRRQLRATRERFDEFGPFAEKKGASATTRPLGQEPPKRMPPPFFGEQAESTAPFGADNRPKDPRYFPKAPAEFELSRNIQNFFWVWLLVLGTLVAGVCYFFAKSLTSSLRKLSKVSNKLAGGDFTVRTGLDLTGYTGNEVHDLAYDFDQMAARLEKQSERQRDLLRDISHELRSPIARIQVATELVRKGRLENIAKIDQNVHRIDTLVGQILATSRSQEGESLPDRVDLEELLLHIVDDALFEMQGQDKGIDLYKSRQLIIRGNSEILHRGIENVLRNALSFTPNKTSVQVALTEHEGMACICIRDFGKGVPETELEDIFHLFYRVKTEIHNRQGNGVGLAIAKESVEFHGGRILAQNVQEGAGLEVRLYIPLSQTH